MTAASVRSGALSLLVETLLLGCLLRAGAVLNE